MCFVADSLDDGFEASFGKESSAESLGEEPLESFERGSLGEPLDDDTFDESSSEEDSLVEKSSANLSHGHSSGRVSLDDVSLGKESLRAPLDDCSLEDFLEDSLCDPLAEDSTDVPFDDFLADDSFDDDSLEEASLDECFDDECLDDDVLLDELFDDECLEEECFLDECPLTIDAPERFCSHGSLFFGGCSVSLLATSAMLDFWFSFSSSAGSAGASSSTRLEAEGAASAMEAGLAKAASKRPGRLSLRPTMASTSSCTMSVSSSSASVLPFARVSPVSGDLPSSSTGSAGLTRSAFGTVFAWFSWGGTRMGRGRRLRSSDRGVGRY